MKRGISFKTVSIREFPQDETLILLGLPLLWGISPILVTYTCIFFLLQARGAGSLMTMHHVVAVRRGIGFVEMSLDWSIGAKRGGFQKLVCCLAAHEQDKGRQKCVKRNLQRLVANSCKVDQNTNWPAAVDSRYWWVLLFVSKYSDIIGGSMYVCTQPTPRVFNANNERKHTPAPKCRLLLQWSVSLADENKDDGLEEGGRGAAEQKGKRHRKGQLGEERGGKEDIRNDSASRRPRQPRKGWCDFEEVRHTKFRQVWLSEKA